MLKELVALAPFVPLLQTLVWAVLIVGFIILFRAPINAVLGAIKSRIEAGGSVKAGWFELSELKPQPPEQQRLKAEQEIAETNSASPSSAPPLDAKSRTLIASQSLMAEDLALRALQSDLGVPINRQIAAGPDAGFDAAFARDGVLNVIEVKFFPGSVTPVKLRSSLENIQRALDRVHWRNVRTILVLVYKRHEDIAANEERVRDALDGLEMSVEVRTFALQELKTRFGVDGGDA